MQSIKITLILVLACCCHLYSQSVSVIHIEGEAYSVTQKDGKEQYIKLMYGPLKHVDKVIIKQNSVVKIINENDQICVLSREGTYNAKVLEFKNVETNSTFSKFCDYFHGFFGHHSSSESKENYKNTIYAISRGSIPPPSLDFPLSGVLPNDEGEIPFIWTHACDSCEYIFSIHDFSNKEIVYTIMTNDHMVEMKNPEKYLVSDKKYYWTVKIVGSNTEDEIIFFEITSKGDYNNKVKAIEDTINSAKLTFSETAKAIFIISELDASDLQNYAIFYGLKSKANSKDSIAISDILDRYWYDTLMEK